VSVVLRYGKQRYQLLASKSLGNSPSNMQQFVFIYRGEAVNLTGEFQYQRVQSFVREPFAAQFQSQKTVAKEFVLVAVHTEPQRTVQEIDMLQDVFQEVSAKFNNQNVMFLGNFYAGCAYLTRADKKNIRLFQNLDFSWLIGDKVDTTVTDQTSCAYDRIVVHGETLLKSVTPYSAKVFQFNREFKVRRSTVLMISDHFPIEVTLK
uniref:Uncharacterized protein n=1 Tax=Tetraodon nigroviridis TaxID=99883 RepID=H3CJY5_TETNG